MSSLNVICVRGGGGLGLEGATRLAGGAHGLPRPQDSIVQQRRRAAASPERTRLHVSNADAVPHSAEHDVAEAHDQHILRHLLALRAGRPPRASVGAPLGTGNVWWSTVLHQTALAPSGSPCSPMARLGLRLRSMAAGTGNGVWCGTASCSAHQVVVYAIQLLLRIQSPQLVHQPLRGIQVPAQARRWLPLAMRDWQLASGNAERWALVWLCAAPLSCRRNAKAQPRFQYSLSERFLHHDSDPGAGQAAAAVAVCLQALAHLRSKSAKARHGVSQGGTHAGRCVRVLGLAASLPGGKPAAAAMGCSAHMGCHAGCAPRARPPRCERVNREARTPAGRPPAAGPSRRAGRSGCRASPPRVPPAPPPGAGSRQRRRRSSHSPRRRRCTCSGRAPSRRCRRPASAAGAHAAPRRSALCVSSR
jgi:hypothetical protein